MIYRECEIPERHGYLLPIGDLHFSDKAFRDKSYKKLIGYRNWVLENKNARVILGGDMFNCASRNSKTSPFEQRMSVNDEMHEIVEILYPIRKQIIGAIEGNHESRMKEYFDLSITETLCGKLDICFMGYSGVVNIKVGKRNITPNQRNKWRENYFVYVHHTTGGGTLMGGGLNRVEKLGNIVEGCDVYLGFHNHKLSTYKGIIFYPSHKSRNMEERVVNYITCGGYLQYENSYAEKGMMRPLKLGSPRIRFDGNKHDVHISI